MTILEENMLELLKFLKQNCGILGIKSDFEAEGARHDETVRLKALVEEADLDLFVKIGGCEAMGDVAFCKETGVKGIIAPMIETSFAAEKFHNVAQNIYEDYMQNVELAINVETATSVENIDKILEKTVKFAQKIIVGRVDLSASMGLSREQIDSNEILHICEFLAQKAQKCGIGFGFGGGITYNSIPFIVKLTGLCSQFESRKVIFSYDNDVNRLKKAILAAMKFEILYIRNKANYNIFTNIDKKRLHLLEERLRCMANF